MEHLERNISINSIKFYNDVTNYIHQYRDVNILKQYYMQKSKMLAIHNNINLPGKDTKGTVKCPKCYVNRTQSNSLYKIVPQKAKSRFLRRVKKMEEGKLTRYQLKCAKKIQDCFNNRLVIKCKICQAEYKQVLTRPDKWKEHIKKVPPIQNKGGQQTVMSKSNLKKKNRKQQQINRKKNCEKMGKLSQLLNMAHKPKKTNLKEFIKSVT